MGESAGRLQKAINQRSQMQFCAPVVSCLLRNVAVLINCTTMVDCNRQMLQINPAIWDTTVWSVLESTWPGASLRFLFHISVFQSNLGKHVPENYIRSFNPRKVAYRRNTNVLNYVRVLRPAAQSDILGVVSYNRLVFKIKCSVLKE